MSDEHTFRCPICRAGQTLRETCRRCQADLRLVMRAHRRFEFVKRQLAELPAGDDGRRRQELIAELKWLAPSR